LVDWSLPPNGESGRIVVRLNENGRCIGVVPR
jgi:hypothetical protein